MMKVNQILMIVLIVVITSTFMMKMKKQAVTKVYVEQQEQQHPRYPLISYDIREMLAPSRRTYMKYPYYASRYGMFMR